MVKKKQSKDNDWIKIIAVILAIVFFLMWSYSKSLYVDELRLREDCEKDLTLQKQVCAESLGTVTDISMGACENVLLEYQSKYDCYDRGSVDCYDKNMYCYDKVQIEHTCDSGYRLACVLE